MLDQQISSTDQVTTRLRWLFDRQGLSQKAFADTAGIGQTQLNNWLVGKDRVSLEGALKLSRAYGVSLDFLYLGRVDTLSRQMANEWAVRSREQNSSKSKQWPV